MWERITTVLLAVLNVAVCRDFGHCSGGRYNALQDVCSSGCDGDWFGRQCETPAHYRHLHCNGNGKRCACIDGFWGPFCDKPCFSGCNICEKLNGECVDCTDHFVFGAACEFELPSACDAAFCPFVADLSDSTLVCDYLTGECKQMSSTEACPTTSNCLHDNLPAGMLFAENACSIDSPMCTACMEAQNNSIALSNGFWANETHCMSSTALEMDDVPVCANFTSCIACADALFGPTCEDYCGDYISDCLMCEEYDASMTCLLCAHGRDEHGECLTTLSEFDCSHFGYDKDDRPFCEYCNSGKCDSQCEFSVEMVCASNSQSNQHECFQEPTYSQPPICIAGHWGLGYICPENFTLPLDSITNNELDPDVCVCDGLSYLNVTARACTVHPQLRPLVDSGQPVVWQPVMCNNGVCDCYAGFESNGMGDDRAPICDPCPLGFACAQGVVRVPCGVGVNFGLVANETGLTECRRCDYGLFSLPNDGVQCVRYCTITEEATYADTYQMCVPRSPCPAGTFNVCLRTLSEEQLNARHESSTHSIAKYKDEVPCSAECTACPGTGFVCAGDESLPIAEPGFYVSVDKLSDGWLRFATCPGIGTCMGGEANVSSLGMSNSIGALVFACAEGHALDVAGCAACDADHFGNRGGCAQCDSTLPMLLLTLFLGGAVLALVLWRVGVRMNVRVCDHGTLFVMATFVQTVSIFQLFQIDWGRLLPYLRFLSIATLDLGTLGPECVDGLTYIDWWLLFESLFIVCTIVALSLSCAYCAPIVHGRAVYWQVFRLLYVAALLQTATIFVCEESPVEGDTRDLLLRASTYECSTDLLYYQIFLAHIALGVLLAVQIMFCARTAIAVADTEERREHMADIFQLSREFHGSLANRDDESDDSHVGGWRAACGPYWFVSSLIRKTVIALLANVTDDGNAQTITTVVFVLTALLAHLVVRPYRFWQLNVLEAFLLLVQALIAVMGAAFGADEAIPDGVADFLAALLITAIVVGVITMLAMSALMFRGAHKVLSAAGAKKSFEMSSVQLD